MKRLHEIILEALKDKELELSGIVGAVRIRSGMEEVSALAVLRW